MTWCTADVECLCETEFTIEWTSKQTGMGSSLQEAIDMGIDLSTQECMDSEGTCLEHRVSNQNCTQRYAYAITWKCQARVCFRDGTVKTVVGKGANGAAACRDLNSILCLLRKNCVHHGICHCCYLGCSTF
ncbi:MAG: hypothetical protein KDB14_10005 [Planctomycetales bacterium]|nr:hypothetical protein [Planctomycetales bacterium]